MYEKRTLIVTASSYYANLSPKMVIDLNLQPNLVRYSVCLLRCKWLHHPQDGNTQSEGFLLRQQVRDQHLDDLRVNRPQSSCARNHQLHTMVLLVQPADPKGVLLQIDCHKTRTEG